MLAILKVNNARPRFDGKFTTSAATTIVASANRTCIIGGTALFNVVLENADLEYSKNEAAFADITDGLTVSFVVGDRLQVRERVTAAPGDNSNFTIKDNVRGVLIEDVTLTRV